MTITTSTTQDPQVQQTDPPATGDPTAAAGGKDPAPTGAPDPNSPEGLRARLDRRQQALDDVRTQLKTWQALGKTPDELAALLAGPPAGTAPAAPAVDADAIRREVEAEVRAAANRRVLEADLRAAATGRLNDPADALRFLDLEGLQLGPDGRAHPDDLADAIAGVLQQKPYLGVQAAAEPRFAGAAGGGARSPEPAKTLAVQIAEAEAAGDYRTSMRLKAQQTASSNT